MLSKHEQKWNTIFEKRIKLKKDLYNTYNRSNDIQIREFQYKCLKRIIPSHVSLHKCKIVSSSLCDFCQMEIETVTLKPFVLGIHVCASLLDAA